ncbi:SLOG family protein [Azospirillum soli]|uniref:SLOG family protein n=1 Tax=Azospirillum soli TaxID=1304799 RepID=UPI001AE23347|nr:SLOG family protein [Azospirillum soli]MBP2316594.1 hypothetical protein [Azospirillum soli]
MRLIVCGGSNYRLTHADCGRLDALHEAGGVRTVLTGGAPGAELGGELWAAMRNIPIRRVAIASVGQASPLSKGLDLAAVADAVAVFPGDRRVQALLDDARAQGLDVHDWRKIAEEQRAVGDLIRRFCAPGFFARAAVAPAGSRR